METAGASPPQVMQSVQLVSNTWTRDSHDLFDFEAHQLHTKSFTIPTSMKCVRSGMDIQMLCEHSVPPLGSDMLMRLVQKEGVFWVDKGSPTSSSKKLWLVVRDLPTCSYYLAEGDVIKLGRFKFRVHQMVASASEATQPELKLDDGFSPCIVKATHVTDLENTCCRICLLDGSTADDPLVVPCQCKGSIEYVHLGCLRHWIKGRLNLSDSSSGSYFYRPLSCELCKSGYPAYIHMDRERLPLVEMPHTAPPFIVLENVVRDSQQHATRGLHVISLAENKLMKLGRGHETDVRIADVSISRCHATIRYAEGKFILEDHNSKFGTLVAMKKPRVLDASGTAMSIQVGRTVLSLSVRPHSDVQPNALLAQPTTTSGATGPPAEAETHDGYASL